MKTFRYKPSIKASYAKQGAVHFLMLRYDDMPECKKQRIEALCRKAAGRGQWKALLQYMTTDAEAREIMKEHYIASYNSVGRMAKKFIENFPDDLL